SAGEASGASPESEAASREPAAMPHEPAAMPHEPAAMPHEPAAMPHELAAMSLEPRAPRPKHTPWVALTLAAANVAVWILSLALGASAIEPSSRWLIEHGGNLGTVTLDGEEWRLFTSM